MENIPWTNAAHVKLGHAEIKSRYGVEGRRVFFNYLDLTASKEDLVAEILKLGVILTATTKFSTVAKKASAMGPGAVFTAYTNVPVPITVTADVAERIVDLILANRKLIVVDLTDTSLFDPIWQRFPGWEHGVGLRIYLILSSKKKNYYQNYLQRRYGLSLYLMTEIRRQQLTEGRSNTKNALEVSAVVALCLLLLPIGGALKIAGKKMSVYGKSNYAWNQLFPTESGVPVPTMTDLDVELLKNYIVYSNRYNY